MEHDELRSTQLASQLRADPQPPGSSADYEAMLRELKVHQLELEAQNQALRETQGLLEQSRSRYADLYDFAPVVCFAFDQAAIVLETNLAGARLIGRERSSIVGRPLLSLVRIDDYNAFLRHIRDAIDSAAPLVSEQRFTTAQGPLEFQLHSVRARNRQGEKPACRTVLFDVTKRRLAERELRAAYDSERTLRRRFEAVDRAFAAVTAALAQVKSMELETLLRTTLSQASELAGAEHAALGIVDKSGVKIESWVTSGSAIEPELRDPATSVAPPPHVAAEAVPEPPTARCVPNPFPGTVASTTFMAVPVRYQGQNRANLCLARSRGGEFSEEARMTVEMFAERIGPVLEVARLQAAREKELSTAHRAPESTDVLNMERVCVADVFTDVASTLEPLAARAKMDVSAEVSSRELLVMADPVRLRQALMNFGSNAVKYGRSGTKVRLCSEQRGGWVRMTVADSGIGIAVDKQPAVFGPSPGAAGELEPGRGKERGLAVTRRLVELMGGSVGFRSTEGEGSDFWIDLPAATLSSRNGRVDSCISS